MISIKKLLIVPIVAGCLGGCMSLPIPLTFAEREGRVKSDYEALFAHSVLEQRSVTMERAMARAIRYHLNTRVKTMEVALAQGLTDVTSYHQIPTVVASAGYEARDRPTTDTQDRTDSTRALAVSWNVLDFGVSYLQTRQQADRVLIAQELRRKAMHNLIQEVQTVFWRAWAAQRLQSQMDPLLARVQQALIHSQEAERQRLQPPMQLLDYQKTLLKTWQQIQELWKGLAGAKVAMAELMNVNPGQDFELVAPDKVVLPPLEQFPALVRLEHYALRHRPELRERDYQVRIHALETRKEMLRLLPGLEFRSAVNYNSGSVYINHVWAESGVKLVWNLLNLLSAPDKIDLSRSQEEYQQLMRRALSMSVLAQVHVGYRRLVQAMEEFVTAQALSEINERLFGHAQAGTQASSMNELDVIHRDAERITSLTRRDVAYADLRNAVGAFFVTLGTDILQESDEQQEMEALVKTMATRLAIWERGEIPGLIETDEALQGVARLEWKIDTVPSSYWKEVAHTQWSVESQPLSKGDVARPEWVIETSESPKEGTRSLVPRMDPRKRVQKKSMQMKKNYKKWRSA
ncbi:MAG: TolC family protein [Magnetococcus sp. YQC-5]